MCARGVALFGSVEPPYHECCHPTTSAATLRQLHGHPTASVLPPYHVFLATLHCSEECSERGRCTCPRASLSRVPDLGLSVALHITYSIKRFPPRLSLPVSNHIVQLAEWLSQWPARTPESSPASCKSCPQHHLPPSSNSHQGGVVLPPGSSASLSPATCVRPRRPRSRSGRK